MFSKTAANSARLTKRWPLSVKLTVWYTLTCFSIVCFVAALMYFSLVSSLDRDHDQFLIGKADDLKQLLQNRPGNLKALKEEVDEAWVSTQYARVCARIINAHGKTLVESAQMEAGLSKTMFARLPHAENGTAPVGTTIYSPSGKPFRALVVEYDVNPTIGQVRIQVALEAYGPAQLLVTYRHRLYWLLGLLLPVSCVFGYVIARRGLRPIAQMIQTTRLIRSTTLDQRLNVSACPAEIAALAATFNGMLDRLEESFDRLARFSADIAHELRTPINNLRVQVEVTLQRERNGDEYRHALASTLEDGVRLSRIIDSLLFMARAQDPTTQVNREQVDLARELEVLREFYDAAAFNGGIALRVDCPQTQSPSVDRLFFQRAVANLIENSLAHTPKGGWIELSARERPGEFIVEVADSGCGMAPEHLSRITDRFYRVDRSRTNGVARVGLGLSIVKSIMILHGGSVHVQSEPGIGTRVSLHFPTTSRPVAEEQSVMS